MKKSSIKHLTITAMCAALCVLLPMAFHALQNAGAIFLPMHIPVLLCGLICGAPYGLICGLLGPLLSHLLTGMPPMGKLLLMMMELACYGALCGLFMRAVRVEKPLTKIYIALFAALLSGRILVGMLRGVYALLFVPGSFTPAMWASGYFVTGLPGLMIQVVLVPILVRALQRARLI